jgi:uncharacterized membrane protein YeaQ/YmgE (transglycosylase-associated protein family)
MGLLAYLVAGVIVAGMVWSVRNGPGYPRLATLVVFGLIGAAIGSMGANVARGEYFDHLDAAGFTAAVLVAFVLLVGVDVRVRRDED